MDSHEYEELVGRLHNLPTELFEHVQRYVFAATPATREINEDYTTPGELQCCSASRANYAQGYYGNGSIFVFHDHDVMMRWFVARRGHHEHTSLIEEVRFVMNLPDDATESTGVDAVWQLDLELLRWNLWQVDDSEVFAGSSGRSTRTFTWIYVESDSEDDDES